MKNIWKLLGMLVVLGGAVQGVHAAQTCARTDFLCFESGPTGNLLTPFRVDAAGNVSILGTESTQGNTILGVVGTGSSNLNTAANISAAIPILMSTPVLQGYVIIAGTATSGNPNNVNGVFSTVSNATTIIGVADVAGSSGAVVNVDYSGLSLVLASGTVNVGDLLVSTVTWPGLAASNNSASAGTIIGTALGSLTAATSPALVRVLLHH